MDTISWDDFTKVELRVGRVLRAEVFAEARKPAYVLHVDFGPGIGTKKSSAQITQHYRPEEIRSLLGVVDAEAAVYHRSLGPLLGEASQGRSLVLVDVDDGSGVPPLPGSTSFEDAAGKDPADARLPAPSPDDLYLVCTGGTTGTPKAVLWRQADVFVSAMGGAGLASRESLLAKAAAGATGS